MLGDGAHAATPSLGQGTNQAMEDALALSILLEGAALADVARRFALDEELRRDRIRTIQARSRRNGKTYRSVELTPRQKAEAMNAARAGNWIPDYDIGSEARETLSAL